ncbi:MlaD family protein [Dysgonomonas sp. 520]|uniref:MlaD family protein n=1 Tax=Dysgonomonas sp. 520 TaxID=2302931 RepID=UPI0013D33562|nr:MlaD family protein [Dysgonomonas sp. 520]NDW10759.1 MCE family protein [Dysgonomonas sp. 520]
MSKIASKEVKIGIAFIISLFILYYGINFLKGINIFKPSNSYIVSFDDVTGLTLSSPVFVNGYQVGLVYSMHLSEDGKKVFTVLNMNKGVKIPKDSKVKLEVSMLGSATIIIEQNPLQTEFISPNDTIYGVRDAGMMDAVTKDMLPQVNAILPKVDSIMTGLQILVNSPALLQSVNNMEQITRNIDASTKQLNMLMSSLNRDVPQITNKLNNVTTDVSNMTSQLGSIDLSKTYNSIDSTLQNIQYLSGKLNESNNSLGLLLNDRQLYDSLSTTINNASGLLQDIKENPSRYINVKVF